VGGSETNGATSIEASDLDLLYGLDKDHELTSVKVCTDRSVTYVKGIQVSYGKFDTSGEIIEAISLQDFGDLNQATSLCTNFYIPQGDYLSTVFYRYNTDGISQLWLTTVNGRSSSYGKAGADDSTIVAKFSTLDKMFFGFYSK